MSGSELFRTYEQAYFELSNTIKTDIANMKRLTGEKRKQAVRNVSKNIDKANTHIRNMDMEANSIVAFDVQQDLKKRLKNYKSDIANLKNDLKKAKDDESSDRQALLDGSDDSMSVTSDDYRQRLAASTSRLDKSSETINRSIQILNETEQMGMETASTLRAQGDQIRGTIGRVQEVNSEINQGGRIIGRMSRRNITTKLIIVCIILVLLGVIVIILGFILWPIIAKLIDLFQPKQG